MKIIICWTTYIAHHDEKSVRANKSTATSRRGNFGLVERYHHIHHASPKTIEEPADEQHCDMHSSCLQDRRSHADRTYNSDGALATNLVR